MAQDDKPLAVIRRDMTGGVNTRQHPANIAENQMDTLENWDIGVVGELRKLSGIVLVADLGSSTGTGLFGFEPDGGTNELLATETTNLKGCTNPTEVGTATFTTHKANFTTGLQTIMVKVGQSGENDCVLVGNGTDNWFIMHQDHSMHDLGSGATSPPKSKVATWYRNRIWIMTDNLLYFSDAFSSDYSTAFAAANAFRMPIGTERSIVGVREMGLICLGEDAVWGVNPSATPAPTTDKPEKILDIGCCANNTVCQVADDVFFLANDGVRGVFRTQQDKLQLGQSFPLSYALKRSFETINWAYVYKACAVYFDNKYFLALPTGTSDYNNEVWVYYPATGAWTVIEGWNVAAWTVLKMSGEDRLYAIDSSTGHVYRAWRGYDNNGTAITATAISREEDFGLPLHYKVGGELEVAAETAGSGNAISVYVSVDGADFTLLGTVSLSNEDAPTLPVDLPFFLADSYVVREKFHLDNLGRFKTIQFKFVNNDDNNDPIILYHYSIATFKEEYETE